MVAHFAGTAPVQWVGRRRVDCRRHPRPHEVWPIRIAPGAFGPALPARALWLSPDHAVALFGALIPIRYLVNGATIVQQRVEEVLYYHVELPNHDLVLAEGLATESYLDTGNRADFDNGGAVVRMHPEFARATWDAKSCAPLVVDGEVLKAARGFLLDRAVKLGHHVTDDPGLCLLVRGRELPAETIDRVLRFRIPPGASEARLVSRSATPAQVRDDSCDHRRLGVAVSRVIEDGTAIPLADRRLGSGWHDLECRGDQAAWRWTDGNASIVLRGGNVLDIEVAITVRYWTDETNRIGYVAG